MSAIWDVIIIGGGPAGSTAAMTLAKEGKKVLVLEKEKFPRFHIGESLLPYNRRLFDDLGLWDKIENAGFMIKRGAQFWLGDATKHIRVTFATGAYTEYPESWQVERSRFDQILLNHARELGATVQEECTVLEHQVTDHEVSVKYRKVDGTMEEVRAGFIMDASGLGNVTANRAGLRKFYPTHRKLAIYGHFNDVAMPMEGELGDILIVRRENSWCWMIPLDEKKTSVGLVMEAEDFKKLGKAPAEVFEEAVQNTPMLKQRFMKATAASPVHVTSDFSYRNDSLVSPRIVRVGDASGFIDPIFSSGVFLAMQSGNEGAKTVLEALDSGVAMTAAMKRYESETRRCINMYWEFIEKFYTEHFTQLFMNPVPFMNLTSAVNAVLAGRTKLPFAARWRLRVFFFFVWLQKRYAVAPRVAVR